jgi:hypothetical protein
LAVHVRWSPWACAAIVTQLVTQALLPQIGVRDAAVIVHRGSMSVTIAESSGYDHKTEVERLLDADETVLSRLWQYENLGLTPQEMSDLEGVAGVG